MRCIHCNSSAGVKRHNELSTSQWNMITKQLVELDCKIIDIFGGELFLRKDWFEISQCVKDYGFKLMFVSNGLLIDGGIVNKLRKLDPYAVAISIDGSNSSTHDSMRRINGSFDKCQKAIELLKEADLPTTVITTVNKKNFNELPEIRSWLMNKGIAWQLQMAIPMGRFQKRLMLTKEDFYATALFIASTRRNYSIKEIPIIGAHCFGYHSKILPNHAINPNWKGCQAGITSIGIQSDGGVKGCLLLPEDFVQGNIKEKNLYDIWNDKNFCSFIRNFEIGDLKGECMNCKFGKKCKGGCIATSVGVTGKVFSDPYCFNLFEKNH